MQRKRRRADISATGISMQSGQLHQLRAIFVLFVRRGIRIGGGGGGVSPQLGSYRCLCAAAASLASSGRGTKVATRHERVCGQRS